MKIGDLAPDFKLKDMNSKYVGLPRDKDFTVVYFYPKDNTPGCTIEAREFTKEKKNFDKMNAEVIGISGGDEKSKTRFCEKNDLLITLLSDPEFKTSSAYGVYGLKKFMGREFKGINRRTFVLDKNMKVIKVYDNVKPLVHAKEVLEFIKEQKNK